MTLDTRMRIHESCDPMELFNFCRDLMGPSEGGVQPRDSIFTEAPGELRNRLGQGFPAILEVLYGMFDGPLSPAEWERCTCIDDDCDPELGEKCYSCKKPQAFLEISWDTGYGYKNELGMGCGGLHAVFIMLVAKWCDERGLTYSWYNEFQGEWYPGTENLQSLTSGEVDAVAWFNNVAMPAIEADAVARGLELRR